MTPIHPRLPGVDMLTVIMKVDEGVAIVYFAGGSIHVCDSCFDLVECTLRGWPTDWGPGFLLPKISSRDRDRRRGMSSGEIVIWWFV